METVQQLFSKKERDFFYGQLQGKEELGGLKVPVQNYSLKIREILLKKQIDLQGNYIRSVCWGAVYNEDVWIAVVELLIKEGEKRVEATQNKAKLLEQTA